MEPKRNEFRERMNQFKKAREANPLLSYWEWKAIPKYDEGTEGIKMTPEQEKKFLEDRRKYAAMSGAISPALDIRTAADFTPIGNAIASKEIYDATSSGNYLDAGIIGASLVVPPVLAKPIKRYIPTVTRTVSDKINALLDKSKALKETEWNNTINRSIERIYDKDVRDRAAQIKRDYGIDIQAQYDKIHNVYTNNYEAVPKAKLTEFTDNARAKMNTNAKASEAWDKEGKPAGLTDFEMQVRKDVEPSREVTDHEVNHWWTYDMMLNPDWRKSELLKITKDFEKDLLDVNPLAPTYSKYFRNWMELNAYGINVVNEMKEKGIPFTKENVINFINSKSNFNSLKRAAYLFKDMDAYFRWLLTMPLAGMASAAYMLGNKEDNSYADGTEGVGLPKYYGAYDPKQLAYVLPVDKDAGVVLPEVEITPQNNTDLAGYMLKGDLIKEAMSFTPVGDVMDLYLIGKDAYEGNYGQAALGASLFLLPEVIAKPISKGIRKIGKNLNARKRANKLFNDIDTQKDILSKESNKLYEEYTLDELNKIVNKKEQEIILNNPSETINLKRINGIKFRDKYKEYLNKAANLSLSVDTKKSLEDLSTELKNLFMKLLWDDPQYIKFAQNKNLPFDSLDTVDKWIEKQRTSIRGVYSDIPDATLENLTDMFTMTKIYNSGGDRLNTNGGLYVSNSDEIANRFSRSQDDKPGTAAYAILKSPDIDRTQPIDSQLAELRRRIFPYDFHNNFNYIEVTPDELLNKGYIGKQAQYTTGDGDLLPAYETAFFAKEPNTKVADIYDYATSNITKNVAGRWGKGAGGADIDDDLYSPRLFGRSFGDFNKEYRTYIESLPYRERMEKALPYDKYQQLYRNEYKTFFDEFKNKLRILDNREKVLKDRRNRLRNNLQHLDNNERKIDKIKPWLYSSSIASGAIATGVYGISYMEESRINDAFELYKIREDLLKYNMDENLLDYREKRRLVNLKSKSGSKRFEKEYIRYLKTLKTKK